MPAHVCNKKKYAMASYRPNKQFLRCNVKNIPVF